MAQAHALAFLGSALVLLVGCGASPSRAGLDASDTNDARDASEDGQTAGEVIVDVKSPEDSKGDSTAMADHKLCRDSCDVTAAVACGDHQVDCVDQCEALLAGDWCMLEARDYLACQVAATSSAFSCVPPGLTTLMPGICGAESDAFRTCAKRDAGGG